MENHIIPRIYEYIINNTIRTDENIRLKEIYNSPVPKSIKNFFLLKTDDFLQKENLLNLKSARFDYSSIEVRKQILRFENLIREHCIFNREEYKALLEESITLQLNYLRSPIKTLVDFVFPDNISKSINKILQYFKYFTDYTYYGEIIESYFEQKEIDVISKEEFRSLLKKIDSAIIKRLNNEEIAWMPKPLYDFINFDTQSKSVYTDLLITFYDDKGLPGLASALKLELNIRGKNTFNYEEIQNVINSIEDIREAPGISREILENGIKDLQEKFINNANEKDKPAQNEETKSTGEIEMQKTEKVPENLKSKRKIIDLSEEEEFKTVDKKNKIKEAIENFDIDDGTDIFIPKDKKYSEENTNEVPVLINKTENIQNENPIRYYHIKMELSDREKKIFVKKLFEKDEVKYQQVIAQIENCSTWNEAAQFIDKLFVENDINPYSNYAVNFTNKVQKAFLTEDKYVN